jgi:hypothetical protein
MKRRRLLRNRHRVPNVRLALMRQNGGVTELPALDYCFDYCFPDSRLASSVDALAIASRDASA